ncbi:sugar phosphate isomerase/epimerase family protein [Haloplanus salilacus]|uniref:sugar phosphate isomerase/epimerase family protein n=1 Tax=Haloplanus salilacus TaxID=2949994 RepID=UPI0030D0A7F7
MTLKERIGVDVGQKLTIEEAVEWAADNDVHYVDVCLDDGPIDPDAYDDAEVESIRDTCEDADISLGLHTLSAVNVAETSAHVDDAVDAYLQAYVDIGDMVHADRIIVHGGYHFTDDYEDRVAASKARLRRIIEYAGDAHPDLLLENHNFEPDASEMKYVPVTLDEVTEYFDELEADTLGWAFNPPHARQFPEDIDGYFETLGPDLCAEVRLNDNHGDVEEHLAPGEGDLDFDATFRLIEESGYDGHYMLAFGTLQDMLDGREYLLEQYSGAPSP